MSSKLLEQEKAKALALLPAPVAEYIDGCLRKPHCESYLIPVLHRVQDHFGYLSPESMDAVSVLMQIPAAKVAGVASFYHFFNFAPKGEHQISLCMGTACFVKGAGQVLEKLKELLGIDIGETTPDGLFSIDISRCVGACALAPVLIVDGQVHAAVRPDKVQKILSAYGFVAAGKVGVS
jgi:NADH:ubiquinone oxidoreductase subunit E